MTWDRKRRLTTGGVAGDVLTVRTAIAERAQCRQLATQAIERFGRIDALVNSAFVHGTFPEAVEDADLDGWRAVFDTNVFGTMTLTQEIVPHMKRQKRGAILMINTQATRKPFAGESGYAVSKGALASACTEPARTASTWVDVGRADADVFPAGGSRVRDNGGGDHCAGRVEHRAREAADRRRLCARGAVPCVGLRERGARRDAGCERRRFHALRREQRIMQETRQARHFFAFNGDADGLCALQQLRLAEGARGTLVTGVKRDIKLLERIDARAGDRVTVLDVSHDQNRDACARLLRDGAAVRYFDHHFAGALPGDPRFDAYIDTAADICTSALVNRYLGGRHVRWAIVAAFGDELPALGDALAREYGIDEAERCTLAELGLYLNYNAYGDCVADLHFDPAVLADAMLPCVDPLDFVRDTPVFAALRDGYRDDMARACALVPLRDVPGATLIRMPDQPWARRVSGMLANERMRNAPHAALAVLSPRAQGGFVVSVRVPDGRPLGADEFCRGFPTGGGRKRAGGINHLPEAEFDAFAEQFEAAFRLD